MIAMIHNSRIIGTYGKDPGTVRWLGIPYAKAKRWHMPELIEDYGEEFKADHYGPASIQTRTYMPENKSNRQFYYHEFRDRCEFTYSEDCQVLNIYAPQNAEKCPVIVYIHGGAFIGGSSDEECFRDPLWARNGVIGVTLNYRLGPLGFLCDPQLKQRDGHSGSYGLYDMITALQWVQKHIAAFGGDPDNVTLMGQSAGARCVQTLCCSPLAKGLFARAVLSSGGGEGNWMGKCCREEEKYALWQDLKEAVGAKTLQELEQLSPQQLYAGFGALLGKDFRKYFCLCNPVSGNDLLPDNVAQCIQSGNVMDIPYLIGSNAMDMDPKQRHEDVWRFAFTRTQPSYAYLFSRNLPGDDAGSFHSSDLWYWFGTLREGWRPWQKRDYDLMQEMMGYLLAFASNGDPNGEGRTKWPTAQSEQIMVFADGVTRTDGKEPAELKDAAAVIGW